MSMVSYTDDGSNAIRTEVLGSRRRLLLTRTEPFGVRLASWFEPDAGFDLVGLHGGSAGFSIVPSATQDACGQQSYVSRLGTTQIQDLDPTLFVDGGVLWVPFPASIYFEWPDITTRNVGMVYYSNESWSAEFSTAGYRGLSYTRYLTDGQVIPVPQNARRVQCSAPLASLILPGGITMQTGLEPVFIGGARTVQMAFLPGMPVSITMAPVTFYYGI